eukprot:COSAG03_NODE_17583_length_372_cov_1.036630_1_plen_61_part_10
MAAGRALLHAALQLLALGTALVGLHAAPEELARHDHSGDAADAITAPPSCAPRLLGHNLDA